MPFHKKEKMGEKKKLKKEEKQKKEGAEKGSRLVNMQD